MCNSTGGASALIINSICTLAGGVGGAVVGYWLTSRNSKKLMQTTHENATQLVELTHNNDIDLMRRQEFIKAAINFRAVFFNLLIFCQQQTTGSGTEIQVADFIIKSIARQTKAALLFRAFLDSSQSSGFDNAWKEYSQQEGWKNFRTESIISEYRVVFYDQTAEKNKRHLVASRVENLFSFAPLQ